MDDISICSAESLSSCREAISERELLGQDEASRLADLFKVLAGETRLMLLHALVREGELSVGELALRVEMKPQAVSNQLHRLLDKGIVCVRRNGNQMHYRVVDHCVLELLERGICLNECSASRMTAGKTG